MWPVTVLAETVLDLERCKCMLALDGIPDAGDAECGCGEYERVRMRGDVEPS